MVLIGAMLAGALWVLPAANTKLARVVEMPRPVREARWLRRRKERVDPFDVAAAYDLFAVCLKAGLPVASAAEIAAEHAPSIVREPLLRAAELLSLGADPETAWSADCGEQDASFADLATLARRTSRAGSSLADGVTELAVVTRKAEADRALEAAERAGVTIGGPLGLCFLPAFVCLGIVPVVFGLASGMLGSL